MQKSCRVIPSRASSRWVSICIFKFTAGLTGGEREVTAAGVFVMRLVHEPEFSGFFFSFQLLLKYLWRQEQKQKGERKA